MDFNLDWLFRSLKLLLFEENVSDVAELFHQQCVKEMMYIELSLYPLLSRLEIEFETDGVLLHGRRKITYGCLQTTLIKSTESEEGYEASLNNIRNTEVAMRENLSTYMQSRNATTLLPTAQ